MSFPYTDVIETDIISVFPGAYVFRGPYGNGNNGMIPIYTSIPGFIDNGLTEIMNDKDDTVIVLPGFKLIMHSDYSYTGSLTTIDNSGGTDIMVSPATRNTASSCQLFYKNNIDNTMIRLDTQYSNLSSKVSISTTGTVSVTSITYAGIDYNTYQFTYNYNTPPTGNGSFSITGNSGVSVHCPALIVAGGGGGGNYNSGGAGGGGAGAFVTTFMRVMTGNTLNITVGQGGPGAGGNDAGYQGYPSSIIRTSDNASIYAYGGTGGGSVNPPYHTGRNDISTEYYGSTAGTWGGSSDGRPPFGIGKSFTVANNTNLFYSYPSSYSDCARVGGTGRGNFGGPGGGGAGGEGMQYIGDMGAPGGTGKVWVVNNTFYAGGAGGGDNPNAGGYFGAGGAGGGAGGNGAGGTANTGGGGSPGWAGTVGGRGGSGIVIIAVPKSRILNP